MSDLREILDIEASRVSAPPRTIDLITRRIDRRRRNRRIASGLLALLIAAAAVGTLLSAFERGAPRPAVPPKITKQNVHLLETAWTGTPGGCCPLPTAYGDTIYVGWNDGLTAYPAYCGSDVATCEPKWVGTITDVVKRPVTGVTYYKAQHLGVPAVADGMVFAADKWRLYAFPIDCATDGRTCQPSWFAQTPKFSYPMSNPVAGNGFVYIGGHETLYAYPTHCATGANLCPPAWTAKGDGQPVVADGRVYTTLYRNVYAYPADCTSGGGECSPIWRARLPETPHCCTKPIVSGGRVYIGSGDRLFAFRTDCGSSGSTCEPDWVGDTRAPPDQVVFSWAVANHMAFASTTHGGERFTGLGHMYAFSTRCTESCSPEWMAQLGADTYLATGNGLLFAATHGGFLVAYNPHCATDGSLCDPVWSAATVDGGAPYAEPSVTDRAVYTGGDTGHIYAFSVPEENR